MWQFLLVAAVAGSAGFFANRLRATRSGGSSAAGRRVGECDRKQRERVVSDSDQPEMCREGGEELGTSADSVEPQLRFADFASREEGVFWFSSPGSGRGNGSRFGARSLRKKIGAGYGEMVRSEKKSGLVNGGAVGFGAEQRSKRKRIGWNIAADKCGSSLLKGGSSFGWGLGVGMMMYVMSLGKSENEKLNAGLEELAKAIKELRAELCRGKSSSSMPISCCANEVTTNTAKCSSEHTENKERNDIKCYSLPAVDDGECPSSVLTEEQEPELLEMDQLEAELELELQKLPWFTAESSHPDDMSENLPACDPEYGAENEIKHQISDPYKFHGVKPSELHQKLSHLLIEQQENQITELESELQTAQLKLNEKEAELQTLKNRVRRLTELSLSTVTDDDTEAHEGSVRCSDNWDYNNMMGSESKQSVVGMERFVDSELCGH